MRLEVTSQELAGDLRFPDPGSGAPWQVSLARVDLAPLLPPAGPRDAPPAPPAQGGLAVMACVPEEGRCRLERAGGFIRADVERLARHLGWQLAVDSPPA